MDETKTSATDYSQLRQEGIASLEKLASDSWTDFNAHDPGITILEQLCYAITDLGYRTGFDIADLLAEGGDDGVSALHRPSEVLTCHPVTVTDFRKLAMDVDGVKNAWVEPVEEQAVPLHFHPGKQELSLKEDPPVTEPVFLKGLYRVLIEKSDLADIDGDVVRRSVAARLNANRGLCEDFEEITVLATQGVKVDAQVDIAQVDDADTVLLGIYEAIAGYLSPTVPFRTLPQMLDAGYRVDAIFDGPALQRGFLETATLKKLHRRTSVHASDLIREIMSVDGVRAVRGISLSSGAITSNWRLDIAAEMTPVLDLENTGVVLRRDQLQVTANVNKVIATYSERQRQSAVFGELPMTDRDIVPSPGRDRALARYHSLLHQFPQVYGIGTAGLPGSASNERRGQARQLKAYLMLFDQMLANLFSQLAHARDLLSYDGHGTRTYFANMIDDPGLDLGAIRVREDNGHRDALQAITESSAQTGEPGDRRNRFLNHLLARYAEDFTDYALVMMGGEDVAGAPPVEKVIGDKQAFLQRYPRVGAGRGTAFDYTRPADAGNISGLEERIRLKLGLVASEDEDKDESFLLIEHILLRAMKTDVAQDVPFLAQARSRDPYSLQLSLFFPDWPPRFRQERFRQLVAQTVQAEMPAHLTHDIRWLTLEQMRTLRAAYADWTEERRSEWKS